MKHHLCCVMSKAKWDPLAHLNMLYRAYTYKRATVVVSKLWSLWCLLHIILTCLFLCNSLVWSPTPASPPHTTMLEYKLQLPWKHGSVRCSSWQRLFVQFIRPVYLEYLFILILSPKWRIHTLTSLCTDSTLRSDNTGEGEEHLHHYNMRWKHFVSQLY